MKTKYIAVSLLASSLLFTQCNSFQQITLDGEALDETQKTDQSASMPTKGKSALTNNNGNLKKKTIWKVDENESLSLREEKGVYQLRAKGVGKHNQQAFYADFPEGLDMRGGLAIKIKARSEGDIIPTLTLQMKDDQGNIANGKHLDAEVAIGEDFVTYYYELDGSFTQVFPTIAEVKAHLITKVSLLINEQDSPYSGSIFIDDIQVVRATEVIAMKSGPVGRDGGVIDDFKNGTKGWSADKGIVLSSASNELKVEMAQVGAKYESISYSFESVNFKTNPKLKIRAKITSEEALFLRADLYDINGSRTSYRPVIRKIEGTGEYVDLIFDYTDRFSQSYPERDVDATRIEKVVIYLNPAYYLFSGVLSIDKIEAMK